MVMDPERFARVKSLVAGAFERPREEREAFLDRACAGDPELRREAESLLAEDGTLPELLLPDGVEGPLAAVLAEPMQPDDTPPQIGPYTVRGVGMRCDSDSVCACRKRISLLVSASASAAMTAGSLSTTAKGR